MTKIKLKSISYLVVLLTFLSSAAFGQGIEAELSNDKVLVNGKEIIFDAYNIKGNNYFKLRDLAKAINGTEKQFEVIWNAKLGNIELISNKPYKEVGGELILKNGSGGKVSKNNSAIYKDGQLIDVQAYTIGGNNYFKLRDITKIFDIGVSWNEKTKTIGIDTSMSYEEAKNLKDYNKDLVGIWYREDSENIYKGDVIYVEKEMMYISRPSHETAEMVYLDEIQADENSILIKGFNIDPEIITTFGGIDDNYLKVNNKNYHIIEDREFLSKYMESNWNSKYISPSVYKFKWTGDNKIIVNAEGTVATLYGYEEFNYDNLIFKYMGNDEVKFNKYIMDKIMDEEKKQYDDYYIAPVEDDPLVGSWHGKILFNDYYLGWWAEHGEWKFDDVYETYVYIERNNDSKNKDGAIEYSWRERTIKPGGSELITESLAYYYPEKKTIVKGVSFNNLRGTGEFGPKMLTIEVEYNIEDFNNMQGKTYTESSLKKY